MSTDCVFNAYYLGSTADDAGKEGSSVEAVQVTLTDLDDDGLIREEGASGAGDLINGELIVTLKDQSILELDDGTRVTGWYIEYEDSSGDKEVYFIPTDDTVPEDGVLGEDVDKNGDQIGDLDDLDKVIPCFTAQTGIMTNRGVVRAIDLKVGDRVITRDNGLQTVRWVGHKSISSALTAADPSTRPVFIPKNCFGTDRPSRDLFLSPQHRIAMAGQSTRLFIAEPEVFAPAIHTLTLPKVKQVQCDVTYVHFLFDRHEIVLTDGLWTESLHPGERALRGFECTAQAEIFQLFPELKSWTAQTKFPLARPSLKRHETALLLAGSG